MDEKKKKKRQAIRRFLVVLLRYCRVILSLSLSLSLRLRFAVIDTFSRRGDVYKTETHTDVHLVFVMMFWLFSLFSHCLLFLRKKDCSFFFYPYRFVYFEHFNKGKFQFILYSCIVTTRIGPKQNVCSALIDFQDADEIRSVAGNCHETFATNAIRSTSTVDDARILRAANNNLTIDRYERLHQRAREKKMQKAET